MVILMIVFEFCLVDDWDFVKPIIGFVRHMSGIYLYLGDFSELFG